MADDESNQKEADQFKLQGNEALKAGKIDEAIELYTKAIDAAPKAVYYSNRAAAYYRQGKWKKSLEDANECIKLEPSFVKGFGRKANALFKLEKYSESIKTYKEALKLDSTKDQYNQGIKKCEQMIKNKPGILKQMNVILQALGHMLLIICAVVSVFPLGVMSKIAFYNALYLGIVLQAFIVVEKNGAPKFKKDYWKGIIENCEAHFIISSAICLMSRPMFLGLATQVIRSSLYVARVLLFTMKKIVPGFLAAKLQLFVAMTNDLYASNAMIELALGFMLIVEMVSPARNPLLMVVWWQFLRVRYMQDYRIRIAFSTLRQKLDEWILHGRYVPSAVGWVYNKIRGLCASQVDFSQQRASPMSRCTIM